jgi:hypothetical protein
MESLSADNSSDHRTSDVLDLEKLDLGSFPIKKTNDPNVLSASSFQSIQGVAYSYSPELPLMDPINETGMDIGSSTMSSRWGRRAKSFTVGSTAKKRNSLTQRLQAMITRTTGGSSSTSPQIAQSEEQLPSSSVRLEPRNEAPVWRNRIQRTQSEENQQPENEESAPK